MTSTQYQIMRLGPRDLETPGARVLGPWEAAQHRTDPPLPHSKPGVSRVASGPNPAPSSAVPTLLDCPQFRHWGEQNQSRRFIWQKLLGTDTIHHTRARKSWHFLLMVGD